MSEDLELPDDARYMADPPIVTRYAGDSLQAVKWYAGTTRTRYQVMLPDQGFITLNIAQASALADMLRADIDRRGAEG